MISDKATKNLMMKSYSIGESDNLVLSRSFDSIYSTLQLWLLSFNFHIDLITLFLTPFLREMMAFACIRRNINELWLIEYYRTLLLCILSLEPYFKIQRCISGHFIVCIFYLTTNSRCHFPSQSLNNFIFKEIGPETV